MSSLGIIQDLYASSDSDSEGDQNNEKLPLPKEVLSLSEDLDSVYNDPNKHHGRIRSFKHERGNWATYVYLPYEQTFLSELKNTVYDIFASMQGFQWNIVDDFHVSVSRTVAIPQQFIDPIVQSLHKQFLDIKRFDIAFSAADIRFYVNDESTRSFCGIEITDSHLRLLIKSIVDKIDETFTEFRCEKFYEEASYHISFAWCLGDILKNQFCDDILSTLKKTWSRIEENKEHLFSFEVSRIFLKCGNKCFNFHLT